MRPKITPIGWSLVWKKQTPAFKKTEKTRWFLMLLGPETSQETLKKPKSRPRSTQRAPKPMQKNDKKNQDKCLRGKKCLKLAISFSTILKPIVGIQNCIFFLDFYWNCWKPFKWKLKLMLKPGLESERDPRGPRWPQKCHHELQSTQNLHLQKPKKKQWFFQRFWLQRPIKKASRGRSRIPKDTQNILDPNK